MGKLGDALTGGAMGAIGQAMGIVLQKGQDRRQLNQQQKLQDQQITGNMKMMQAQKEKELEIWNKTNYEAQKQHMINAGLNPGLMYGMSGGGGATTGGGSATVSGATATDPSQAMGVNNGMGLMLAQQKVLESQARLNNIEADKKSGIDTAEGETRIKEATERTAGKKFQNAVNNAIGADNIASKEHTAIDSLKLHWSKQLAEYETWETVNYAGKPTDDPYSPIAKAMRAGIEKTLVDLQQAKTDNNIAKATETIKEFEANLTREGIAAGSPWYVKIISDFLTKIGMNPIEIGKEQINKLQK